MVFIPISCILYFDLTIFSYIVTVLELMLVILMLIKATSNHVRQETLYTLSREWLYLSFTELVAKTFYLLLCSIIKFVCILIFVTEMVIKYV